MTQDFHSLPRTILGINDSEDSSLTWYVDRTVWRFGSFIPARRNEPTSATPDREAASNNATRNRSTA